MRNDIHAAYDGAAAAINDIGTKPTKEKLQALRRRYEAHEVGDRYDKAYEGELTKAEKELSSHD